jgi:hypothetical protein
MDKRVLGMAKILIEGAIDLSRLKIYLTGEVESLSWAWTLCILVRA